MNIYVVRIQMVAILCYPLMIWFLESSNNIN